MTRDVIPGLISAAALIMWPQPGLSNTTTQTASSQAMAAECAKRTIIGANANVSQIAFYNKDDTVIETLKTGIKPGELAIPVLSCDATWFFVKAPSGTKAKVYRIDVQTDGKCTSVVVDPARTVAATNGLGVC